MTMPAPPESMTPPGPEYNYLAQVTDGTSAPDDYITFKAPDGLTAWRRAHLLASERGLLLVKLWTEVGT